MRLRLLPKAYNLWKLLWYTYIRQGIKFFAFVLLCFTWKLYYKAQPTHNKKRIVWVGPYYIFYYYLFGFCRYYGFLISYYEYYYLGLATLASIQKIVVMKQNILIYIDIEPRPATWKAESTTLPWSRILIIFNTFKKYKHIDCHHTFLLGRVLKFYEF